MWGLLQEHSPKVEIIIFEFKFSFYTKGKRGFAGDLILWP